MLGVVEVPFLASHAFSALCRLHAAKVNLTDSRPLQKAGHEEHYDELYVLSPFAS